MFHQSQTETTNNSSKPILEIKKMTNPMLPAQPSSATMNGKNNYYYSSSLITTEGTVTKIISNPFVSRRDSTTLPYFTHL